MRESETAETDSGRQRRVVVVGWLLDTREAGFIYEAPRPLGSKRVPARAAKALSNCPAVLDVEARYFEIPCPMDLILGLGKTRQGRPGLLNTAGLQSAIEEKQLRQFVELLEPARWRDPRYPVLQVRTPYRFVADEPVWLEQVAAFSHPRKTLWPGLFIGRRLPIDIWPQRLSWTFEWREGDRELVLRRGEPWFYLSFETPDPDRPIRLVEAEMTPELRAHCAGLDEAGRYTDRDLFDVARRRRPKTLLRRVSR